MSVIRVAKKDGGYGLELFDARGCQLYPEALRDYKAMDAETAKKYAELYAKKLSHMLGISVNIVA